jgi:Cys-tRNA(Pro)/Cys-tRNA(Cys) deacylase
MAANNVTRLLDAKKVPYVVLEIPSGKLSALEVADFLKVSPDKVYKTIVARRSEAGKHVLAIVPANGEVDTKKLAQALGEKKMNIHSMRNAEAVTGLQAGSISALALINKGFQVVIDAHAREKSEIIISAGQRGLQVRLSPEDLARLTNARFFAISNYG